jgi:hypothetical protein
MQKIGQLFLLRTNINSVGSVLDSPVSLNLFARVRPTTIYGYSAGSVLGKFQRSHRVLATEEQDPRVFLTCSRCMMRHEVI